MLRALPWAVAILALWAIYERAYYDVTPMKVSEFVGYFHNFVSVYLVFHAWALPSVLVVCVLALLCRPYRPQKVIVAGPRPGGLGYEI